MSTATIAFVRGVIAASTAAGSRFSVAGSTSANTGVAPSKMKQFAEETNETGDVITSSPSPSRARCASRCSPAVPLETAAAKGAPARSANSRSKLSIVPPSDSRPERSTSSTSSSSRPSKKTPESGIELRSVVLNLDLLADSEKIEPLGVPLVLAVDDVPVRLLELERDRADADLLVVDRAHRRN